MDSRGYLHHLTPEQAKQFEIDNHKPLIELSENQHRQLQPQPPTKRKNWMRNQPCVCGSGRKFKVCCWSKYA